MIGLLLAILAALAVIAVGLACLAANRDPGKDPL